MPPLFSKIVDGALDRALADPTNARMHLAFAGAVDAIEAESERLPVPVLLSMGSVTATRRAVEVQTSELVRGAAFAVLHRNMTVGEAAALAGLPAGVVSDAV